MANSRKPDSGCFSSILRHVLCRNGIPTHPSAELDHGPVPEEKRGKHELHGKEVAASFSDRPGIVARLMGLETLPLLADPAWPPKFKKSPNCVPRSRSVNFMDHLLEIDLNHVQDSRHRRVRTSVSFREDVIHQLPQRRQSHEQDLLVLYLDELENESKNGGARTRLRRQSSVPGDPELREKRRARIGKQRKVSKLRNEQRRVNKEEAEAEAEAEAQARARARARAQHGRENGKQRGKLIQEKEVMAESKFTKKRREGKAVKRVAVMPIERDSSEDASPVSVLDIDEYAYEQGTSTAQDVNVSPKKYSSPQEKLPRPARVMFERRSGSSKKRACDPVDHSTALHGETDHPLSVAVEVYRLTEEDILKNLSWASLNLSELGSEEISAMVEHQVLDVFLEQLLDDLCAT